MRAAVGECRAPPPARHRTVAAVGYPCNSTERTRTIRVVSLQGISTVKTGLALAAILLGLSITAGDGGPARASEPDRLPQMTVLIEDAALIVREIATCRSNAFVRPSPKWREGVEAALRAAALDDQQITDLLRRFETITPLIGDDRPIAEAVLFCDTRPRGDNERADRFFRLVERITTAAATPAGRDDALIRDAMTEVMSRLRLNRTCLRLENGPFPPSRSIDPGSPIGKQLARFDISPAMRAHLDTLYEADSPFDGIKTVGELRTLCTERALGIQKMLDEKITPPSAIDILKALQPTR